MKSLEVVKESLRDIRDICKMDDQSYDKIDSALDILDEVEYEYDGTEDVPIREFLMEELNSAIYRRELPELNLEQKEMIIDIIINDDHAWAQFDQYLNAIFNEVNNGTIDINHNDDLYEPYEEEDTYYVFIKPISFVR